MEPVKNRIRFEPIDVDIAEFQQFRKSYEQLRNILNEQYGFEIIPSIRKFYLVDEYGFPVDERLNNMEEDK